MYYIILDSKWTVTECLKEKKRPKGLFYVITLFLLRINGLSFMGIFITFCHWQINYIRTFYYDIEHLYNYIR